MVKKLLVSACFVVFCLFGSQAQTVKATVGIKGMGIATMPNTELEPTTKVQFGGGGGAFFDGRAELGYRLFDILAMVGAGS